MTMSVNGLTLTMNREGEFRIWATGPNHCGVAEDLLVKYKMVCECDSSTLDKRGFLFDQINVDNYFQRLQESELSCEKLVVSCAKELVNMIKKENPKCVVNRIRLTLSPAPHKADMTYEWTPPTTEPKKPKAKKASEDGFIKF